MEALHTLFAVCKFLFGLGALGMLLAIGAGLLWFALRALILPLLRAQPAPRFGLLRKLFLEP
ncbi:MAG: hypothetical protein KatS3mg131_2893 [Candidatus Tectimicrobiota bacterium]|nr:MAG: hypothetical protein KatS3mg131_2893 [Candidatus Tectomicrobia bacterium]